MKKITAFAIICEKNTEGKIFNIPIAIESKFSGWAIYTTLEKAYSVIKKSKIKNLEVREVKIEILDKKKNKSIIK